MLFSDLCFELFFSPRLKLLGITVSKHLQRAADFLCCFYLWGCRTPIVLTGYVRFLAIFTVFFVNLLR